MIIVLGIFFGNILSATDIIDYTATFELNGADSIGADSLTGESVVAPSITRDGWEILGWSIHSGSIMAEYDVGDTIVLSGDTTFYAITKKTYTATFQSNGADSIGTGAAVCDVYSTQTSCTVPYSRVVQSAVYGVGILTVCNPNDATECLTLMDKSLGSSVAGFGSDSYGKYYQRGNNYGFANDGGINVITDPVSWDDNYDIDGYYSGAFTTSIDYRDDGLNHANLWGGLGDDNTNGYGYPMLNASARQGPCPDGYHVPSQGEWRNALSWWAERYNNEWHLLTLDGVGSLGTFTSLDAATVFRNDFLVPFDGYLDTDANVSNTGNYSIFWTSTPNGTGSMSFDVNQNSVNAAKNNSRIYGYTVRCFKNDAVVPQETISAPSIDRGGWNVLGWSTDAGDTVAGYQTGDIILLSGDTNFYAITQKDVVLSFDSEGGTMVESQTGVLYSTMIMTGQEPSEPTRAGSVFTGWYESGSNTKFDFQNTSIESDTVLYAHWDCEAGYIENESGDACMVQYLVTFDPGEGTIDTGMMYLGSGDMIDLSEYTATRYGFVCIGRAETSGATEPLPINLIVTGDKVLYAVYKVDSNNNGIADEDEIFIITFDSMGGTEVSSQENIPLNATGQEPSEPTRAGSVFTGWYESGSNTKFDFQNTEITSDITLYAHWDCDVQNGYELNGDICILSGDAKTIMQQNPDFQYDIITVYRPASLDNSYKNSPSKYVIMDRNLGSTSAGTGAEAYGYYYQYGNNYGFSGDQWVLGNTMFRNDANIDLTLYGLGTANGPYYGTVFIRGRSGKTSYQDWATTSNENIWGSYEIKESDRQGPCPSGYHVPTIDEWSDVVAYRSQGSGGGSMDVEVFINDLKLPLQGELGRTSGSVDKLGKHGLYRVTTPETESDHNDPHKAYAFLITGNNNQHDLNLSFSDNRVNGYAVRCFRDDDTIYTITYDDGVVQSNVFSDQVYTGIRGDYVHAFSGGIPVWDGEKLFDGWYIGTSGEYELVDPASLQIQSDITFYAKWSECEEYDECVVPINEAGQVHVDNLEVYFAMDSGHIDHYTLMDRNLGATRAGTGVDSYGAFFQWGNNYPFSRTGAFENISTSRVNTQGYGPDNYYNSSTFISGNNNWSNPKNDNLWGDTDDTPEARRGPCPDGYHVPSTSEWLNIHNSWSGVTYGNENGCSGDTECTVKIQNDLLLPSVGRIAQNGQYGFPDAASYWTSSPTSNGDKAYGFYYNSKDRTAAQLQPNNQDPRARARSLRCVKDVNTVPIDIKLNGGEKGAISIYSGNLHYLTNPTRSGYEFEGWYKDLARGIKIEDGEYISPTVTTLYAKWSGEVYDIIYTATFEANGATSIGSTGISCSVSGSDASGQWCAVVAPTITRDGWNILGWSTDSGASIAQYAVGDDIYLYEDMTYYAITSLVPYYVRHYLKDVGTGTYTLQDTETLSGTTNEVLFLSGFARDDIPCARYMNGSLSGSETGPGETIDYTSISPDGATVIYLYYTRSVFSVELTGDIGIGFLDGAGPFECGEVVEINAYPIEGYHFDMRELLEGEIDDSG